jgi:amino acid transporter
MTTQEPAITVAGTPPPPAAEASAKGLKSGALGLFASVIFGVASVAPAYSMAATAGLIAGTVGLQGPMIMILGFIPMLLTASGFYYMNRADPDCGETFIWTARAFGPAVGWVLGFAAVASSIIVMANLVWVASYYAFLLFNADGLANSIFWVTLGGVGWIIFVAVFVAIGIQIAARVQYFLMALQIIPLALFTVWAIVKAVVEHPKGYQGFHFGWLMSTHVSASGLAAGVVLAVFLYWGWDSVTAVNEESENSSHMPGVSAVLNTIILVITYIVVMVALQMYHGAGFLAKNPDDVFSPLAKEVMGGGWDKLLFLCLITSGAASALTTLLPLTRQTLSMAAHKSLPKIFGRVHPKFMTPFWGTVILTALSILWYVVLEWVNDSLLWDAISALGIMVCLTYGGTGLAATIYYRKELRKSLKNFLLIGVAPSLGGLMLLAILVKVLWDDWKPDSSLVNIGGHGAVFVMGVGTVGLGIVLMILMWIFKPEFFRRKPETWPGEGQPIPYSDERVELD